MTNNPTVEDPIIAQLLKQNELLMQQNALLQQKINDLDSEKVLEISNEEPNMRLDELVKVQSLYPYKLNLTTSNGRNYPFRSFGEVKPIPYGELLQIMDNHRTFLEEGWFYILNKKVIRHHGLEDTYKTLLDKETLEKILTCDLKESIALYKTCNDVQKGFIVDILVNMLIRKEELDMNFIAAISKVAGVNIQEKADETLALLAPKEVEK